MDGDPDVFSFSRFCENAWASDEDLVALAKAKKLLISDVNGRGVVAPSLDNIRHNFSVLRAFTKCMAINGVIVTKHIDYLKEPIMGFYENQKINVKTEHVVGVIHGTASFVKRMLGMIKKKWSRWEMPRDSLRIHSTSFLFIFFSHTHAVTSISALQSISYPRTTLSDCWSLTWHVLLQLRMMQLAIDCFHVLFLIGFRTTWFQKKSGFKTLAFRLGAHLS